MKFKKGALEINYIIMIIIALLVLAVILYFVFKMGGDANDRIGNKLTCTGFCVSDCDKCQGACTSPKNAADNTYCCVGIIDKTASEAKPIECKSKSA